MELDDFGIDVGDELDFTLQQYYAGLGVQYPDPTVYDAALTVVRLMPVSDPLPPPPPHLIELFDRRPGLLVAAVTRFGLLTLPCEHCGGILNLRWELGRTQYADAWRNRSQLLCVRCARDHHDYWDSMWSEIEGHWKGNKTLEEYSPRYRAIVNGYRNRRAVDPVVPDEWYDLPKKEFKARTAELWFCERPEYFQTNFGFCRRPLPGNFQQLLDLLRVSLENREAQASKKPPYLDFPSDILTDGLARGLGRDPRVLVRTLSYFGAHLTPCPRCWTFSVPSVGGGCAHCVPPRRFRGLPPPVEPAFISGTQDTCRDHDHALDDDPTF